MRHVTIAQKSLLLGNEAADTLMRFAALTARTNGGDAITLRAIDVSGEEVRATFLLNSGTVMVSESSRSTLPEPDNDEVAAYMTERLESVEYFPVLHDLGVLELDK